MNDMSSYDVFLSYNTQDHAIVEKVARNLKERGFSVFLDRWYLVPGQAWQDELEAILASCDAVVIIIGPSGLGAWQHREQQLALNRKARDKEFQVIPVLLKGSDPPLGFLELLTWVDLSRGDESVALDILEAAIRGQALGSRFREEVDQARASVCPFRGLLPFREEDAEFFCGREAFTQLLLSALQDRTFLAVVGASGSGKSSVVRAGIVPALRVSTDTVWEIATIVPGNQPMRNLAAAMVSLGELEMTWVDRLGEISKLTQQLELGRLELADVAADLLKKQSGTERLLLFVDQWEELYTLTRNQEQIRTFQNQLMRAAREGPVSVVLTMRGDFFGQALGYRDLADQMQDAVVNLGPMKRDELERSMIVPAQKVHLGFEQYLVERILDDVGDEPGNLPLLEFVLNRLWERRRGNLLQNETYIEMGGVQGAIADRADSIFAKLDVHKQELVRRIMIQLVRPGEGTDDTRQRTVLPEARDETSDVVKELADARLLVTTRDEASGREIVEVTHEALIRKWSRLREWIDQDREFLRTRTRIETAARQWEQEGAPEDRLLPPGRPLAEGEDLLNTRPDELTLEIARYIEVSVSAEQAREQARKEGIHRRLRRSRLLTAVMTVLALISVVVGYLAYDRSIAAFKERNNALAAQAGLLGGLSKQQTASGDTTLGILLALEALPLTLDEPEAVVVPAALVALDKAVHVHREVAVFGGRDAWIASAAFDHKGGRLVTASYDNTAQIWDARTGKSMGVLRGHENDVWSATFSTSGQRVITAGRDGTARIWEVASQRVLTVLQAEELNIGAYQGVISAKLNGNGSRALTVSQESGLKLWDAETGMLLATLVPKLYMYQVEFDASGKQIIAGGWDTKMARLWNVADGKLLAEFKHPKKGVLYLALDKTGNHLLTVSRDGNARLWDAATGKLSFLLKHDSPIVFGIFDYAGGRVVTGDEKGTVGIWDTETGKLTIILRGHDDAISRAIFSPTGERVVTASMDHTARLWDAATGKSIAILVGHEGAVLDMAFSPSGRWIATASADRTARLWDARNGDLLAILRGHEDSVTHLAFNRDDTRLLTVSADHSVRLWATEVGTSLRVLRNPRDWIEKAVFSSDAKRLLTTSDILGSNSAVIWNVESGERITTIRTEQGWAGAMNSDGTRVVWDNALWDATNGKRLVDLQGSGWLDYVAYNRDSTRIIAIRRYGVWLYDAVSGKRLFKLSSNELDRDIFLHAAFNEDGSRVVLSSRNHTAQIWDTVTGEQLAVLRGHTKTVSMAEFNRSSTRVLTLSYDNTIALWDASTGERLKVLKGHMSWINYAAFDPNGLRIVTASKDKTARIWDTATGEQTAVLRGHTGEVYHAAFSPDGHRVLTGSFDNTARLWRADTGELITVLRGHNERVEHVAFSPDGKLAVTSSKDGTARIWPMLSTGQELLHHARCLVPRELNEEERTRFGLGEDTGKGRCVD